MLILSLSAVARAPVHLRGEVPHDDPIWADTGLELVEPVRFDLEAREVGEGVLVRGTVATAIRKECRRCLTTVLVGIEDEIGLLYEPMTAEEEAELAGEVYPLPAKGDELDLGPAVREQIVLRAPDFVVCSETCQGLCPTCGADLNRGPCGCAPSSEPSPWDALKNVKFD